MTFDCFGTLVDWHNGFCAILSRAGIDRVSDLEKAYHRHEAAVESERYRSYREATRVALERAAADLAIELSANQKTAIADNWAELPVFDDTVPALTQLRQDGWNLAVLTNCDEDLFAQTQRIIGVSFDALVTAQLVRSYKPAPAHFEYFRNHILGAGDTWVHTACSWFHDVAPARQLEIPRIWIDRDKSGDDPAAATAVLPDLRRLPETAALFDVGRGGRFSFEER
jgi:2-haloacid dehalogenase